MSGKRGVAIFIEMHYKRAREFLNKPRTVMHLISKNALHGSCTHFGHWKNPGGGRPLSPRRGLLRRTGGAHAQSQAQGHGLFPHSLGSSDLLHHALVPLNAEEARGELLPSLEATFNGDDPLMELDI